LNNVLAQGKQWNDSCAKGT